MTQRQGTPVRVEIVSDIVCPWCIIGFKQFELAAETVGIEAQIFWHPFELNPQMVPEGENLREHLAAKYGTTLDASRRARQRLMDIGVTLGFSFNYADDMRMYPTFRAHQLLHWADTQDLRHELQMRLFCDYFTYRRNVNDTSVLVRAAEDCGLDASEAATVLYEERYAQAVLKAEHAWLARGVRGVPAMIFDGQTVASGAQGVENYTAVLRQLVDGRANRGEPQTS